MIGALPEKNHKCIKTTIYYIKIVISMFIFDKFQYMKLIVVL